MTNLYRLHKPYLQSPWLDNLSRELLANGELYNYIFKGVRGITTNPTIVANAIASSAIYDEQIKRLHYEGMSTEEIYWQVIIDDIKSACDAFSELYDKTDKEDGFVSLEVSPLVSQDIEATLVQARQLWQRVDRPNLMIKIPATEQCIPAIQILLAENINVNVTLIFSLRTYKKVAEAHSANYRTNNNSTSRSVASVFISRIDSEVDRRLESIGSPEALALRGKIGVSQAKLAYDIFLDNFSKIAVMDKDNSAIQKLLWASTSTKNPAYSDLLYVEKLIAPLTINTMTEDTLEKVIDHLPEHLTSISLDSIGEALRTIQAVQAVGVNFDEVYAQLELEGLKKFEDSYREVLATIDNKKSS